MSEREMCIDILGSIPDFKLNVVLAYLQGFKASEEAEDDRFCERMLQSYESDPLRMNEETLSIEAAAAELGVEL